MPVDFLQGEERRAVLLMADEDGCRVERER